MEAAGVLDERASALLGLVGPLVAFSSVALAILLSPGFSWQRSALSDLGHATASGVAPLFNFGLLLGGFLVAIYSVAALAARARYTSYGLLVSALLLQLVAVFDEVYGSLHFSVSVLLFASFGFASVAYAVEKRSVLAAVSVAIGLCAWSLYYAGVYDGGIAIPETISSLASGSWVVWSALPAIKAGRK